jgi:long-chain acyl-CoA synthetase
MGHQGTASPGDAACLTAGVRTRHAWEGHYPPHLSWHLDFETGTLTSLLDAAADRWGEKPFIEYRDRQTSFRQIAALVDRLAAGFMVAGYGPGRTIALYLPNTPWHTVCLFAGARAGAKMVHLSPLDAPRELLFKLSDSGADVVITTNLGGLATNAARLAASGAIPPVLVGDDAFWGGTTGDPMPAEGERICRLEAMFRDVLPAAWPVVRPEDIAMLQYTGGTTGMPKGAILTHANIVAATYSYLGWRDDSVPPSGMQRVIGVLPMFHVYALGIVLMLNLVDGNEVLLRPRFDVKTTLQDIEMKRATSLPAVPTMLIALLSEPGAEARDYSSLTMIGSGGAPLPAEVNARAEALFGRPLRLGWGMTETAAVGTRVPPGIRAKPGMIGAPLPNVEMRIVSLSDPLRVLPPGEIGEIATRGPNVFSGYWNQPETSAASFADGWFLTGDIGSMDETGLFTLVDRKKRMIISGGFNVYPNMIENSIYEHPDVEEVIVIGVPDPYRGEAAKAFVKLRAGAAALTLEGLRDFLGDRVGRHEMPTALELRDSLPKSPVGKLLATRLADEERARRSESATAS